MRYSLPLHPAAGPTAAERRSGKQALPGCRNRSLRWPGRYSDVLVKRVQKPKEVGRVHRMDCVTLGGHQVYEP